MSILMFRGHFPDVAYFLPDKDDIQNRQKIRIRVVSEPDQYFNQSIDGLMDTGTSIVVKTPTKLQYRQGARLMYNNIVYSVSGIAPYYPDKARNRMTKAHVLVEYTIMCQ